LGENNYLSEGDNVGGNITVFSTFTITSSTVFEFKYQCSYTKADNGLGFAMSEDSAIDSVFGQLKIRKLK
jgi:hypothetical protein